MKLWLKSLPSISGSVCLAIRGACLSLALFGGGQTAAASDISEWGFVDRPAAGAPDIIGSYAGGCIAGAVQLPPEGLGYQAIRLSRNRTYGHPELIRFLQDFGRKVAAARLGSTTIGDLSQPRGGPMPSGHTSHQIGLDADIWLRLDLGSIPPAGREDLLEISMIDPATRRVDPARFTEKQAEFIRLAAEDPRVERIFVAPGIKLALCDARRADYGWLGKVRPWFGHTGHMHVRLRCPAGQPDCRAQDEVPAGAGCGTELTSWFKPPSTKPGPSVPSRRPPPPLACDAVLAAPAMSR